MRGCTDPTTPAKPMGCTSNVANGLVIKIKNINNQKIFLKPETNYEKLGGFYQLSKNCKRQGLFSEFNGIIEILNIMVNKKLYISYNNNESFLSTHLFSDFKVMLLLCRQV